ncbi:hypothetical protein [Bacillus sp. REN10]|uniref:hypothetical protein n=1 Tax=Bacillus sp. REN10 TaxID=2782541 RepID=UPI00193C463D|nr:hypothetical protein [Bacillus sp. REN10]
MTYIYELQNMLGVESVGFILELLLITSCLSTIIHILTKNQYVSLLCSAPIFYLVSMVQYQVTHLFLLLLAILVQAIIIVTIERQLQKKEKDSNSQKILQ